MNLVLIILLKACPAVSCIPSQTRAGLVHRALTIWKTASVILFILHPTWQGGKTPEMFTGVPWEPSQTVEEGWEDSVRRNHSPLTTRCCASKLLVLPCFLETRNWRWGAPTCVEQSCQVKYRATEARSQQGWGFCVTQACAAQLSEALLC